MEDSKKKSYVETIAGQWKRLNIETVEDAMKVCEKEHKKMKGLLNKNKSKVTKEVKEAKLPAWFDKELDNAETTPEEEEELNKILKELV